MHKEIDALAFEIESKIKQNEMLLDELPEFESRRRSNRVQLRKVMNGDVEGMVTDDE